MLAAILLALVPQAASADTIGLAQYRQRLQDVRSVLVRAREGGTAQAELIRQADSAIRTTNAVRLVSGDVLTVNDESLARNLEPRSDSLDAAIARLDARLHLLARIGDPAIDPAVADARLRDAVRASAARESGDLVSAIGQVILRFLSGLKGPGIDVAVLWQLVGGLGIAVILFILATLGRGLPERVRREVFVRDLAAAAPIDPAVHLRDADAALSAGRPRDAIHAFFLYVVAALASRELIRYDPALTDRELLVHAAAIPHADSFRELVAMYERSWFGVREPSETEARRARDLALRVAP